MISSPVNKTRINKNKAVLPSENGLGCNKTQNREHLRSFLNSFTWERFRKNPDIYRKRIYDIVNNVTHHSQAVIELLRTVDPELQQLERQLGLLNMKFCTYYEHFAFNKQLRKHAEQILDNFDLSTGKTIDEAASEAPPLLRTKVRLYQIRWRKAIASSRWQKDFEEASKNLANVHECYERFKHESRTKKDQLDICRKIYEMKEDLIGLSDIDIMEKIRSEIGMILLRNSISRSRSTSLSSDESCWDNLLSCNYDNIVPSQNSQHHSTL